MVNIAVDKLQLLFVQRFKLWKVPRVMVDVAHLSQSNSEIRLLIIRE